MTEATPEAGRGPTGKQARAVIAAANANGHLLDWSRVRSACPECGQRHVVDVRQVLRLAPIGSFSLAGAQLKAPARVAWVYKCTACGAEGDAEPKGEADD